MAGKYGPSSARKVRRAIHEMKEGTLRSGRSRKKVTRRKQAIAIGLSEARRDGQSPQAPLFLTRTRSREWARMPASLRARGSCRRAPQE